MIHNVPFLHFVAIAFVSTICASGCLTLTRGGTANVPIDSLPQGAKVFQDGILKGTTPLTLKVNRKSGCNVVVEKEGFLRIPFQLRSTNTGVHSAGELALFMCDAVLLGLFLDMGSGALYGITPDSVNLVLLPEDFDVDNE